MSDFEWSPKDNVLAYWAPEQANAPARVSVIEIPSRKELRQKNLVMVSECRLHWQVSILVWGLHVPFLQLYPLSKQKSALGTTCVHRTAMGGMQVEQVASTHCVVALVSRKSTKNRQEAKIYPKSLTFSIVVHMLVD